MADSAEEFDIDEDKFEDWEEDEDDEEEEIIVKSLFSNIKLPSIELFMQYDKENYNFHLQEIMANLQYNDISLIKLINMIRRRVSDVGGGDDVIINPSFINDLKDYIRAGDFLNDDGNMRPVLENDPLLFLLRDFLVKNGIITDDEDDIDMNENRKQNTEVADVENEMKETLVKYQSLIASLTAAPDINEPDDSYYFDSYSNIAIHETMLRDEPRTSSYADALVANADFLKGKTVLDVGCGTGILCMLAVRAGAKKVIGVDCSSIIERTQKVIDRNGMSDKITLVRGRLEEIKLPLHATELDIIVSEWMGYGLYFENMLSSVIYARDNYMSDKGVLMPSSAQIYIEAMTAEGSVDRVAWWSNVYGFDMTDMADLLSNEAQVQLVDEEDIISDRNLAHRLDMNTASDADLDFTSSFTMVISKDSDLRAFVVSFDVLFAGPEFTKTVVLSTSVQTEPTHWKQTALWLEPTNRSLLKINDIIQGEMVYKRSPLNARDYNIKLSWKINNDNNEKIQNFKLAS